MGLFLPTVPLPHARRWRGWVPTARQVLSGATGRADETDTAFSPGGALQGTYGIAQESDLAASPGGQLQGSPGRADEGNAAFAPSGSLQGAPGLAHEGNTAFALVGADTYGSAQETDTAFAPSGALAGLPGLAQEAEAAFSPGGSLRGSPGLAAEGNSASAPTASLAGAPGLAQEADAAFAPPVPTVGTYGIAEESDTAFGLTQLIPDLASPPQTGGSGGHRGWDRRSHKQELETFLDQALRQVLEVPAEVARPERAAEVLIRMAPDLTKVEALIPILQARSATSALTQARQLDALQRRLQVHLEEEEAAALAVIL